MNVIHPRTLRPLTLEEARAVRKKLMDEGKLAQPIDETLTVGDRLDEYINELEVAAGLRRSAYRYQPLPQPEPGFLDKPLGTLLLSLAIVCLVIFCVLALTGTLTNKP
jgi:hypothetical protein